jgi:uncharacterized hydrophobic protein (TIGR00271 family)
MGALSPSSFRFGLGRTIVRWRNWWRDDVRGTVDHAEVMEQRRDEGALTSRYLFLTAMSAGIAILGLLLSSPAVVIGAMLLSPLMGPIVGLGFAVATADYRWMRQTGASLAWGSFLAVGLSALIVALSPLQEITSEIAARTRPNLFDLLVAVFSGLAGAYALIRGKEGAVVGVAIATALMPPLATIGFGLATFNWTVFSGALLLFVTNFVAIALFAALIARLYGFKTYLSGRHTVVQNLIMFGVLIALAVPLGLSLIRIGWETQAQRVIRAEIVQPFGSSARLSEATFDFRAQPIVVSAAVLTPKLDPGAERKIAQRIEDTIGQPVDLALVQYRVGTTASAAEEAQLAAARDRERRADLQAVQLGRQLAVLAGVEDDEILIDRQRRRAQVRGASLEGADMATWRALERRLRESYSGWRIEIVPPAGPLPAIEFVDGEPTAEGLRALALAGWASRRVGAPLVLTGPAQQTARAVEILAETGTTDVEVRPGGAPLGVQWGQPRSNDPA